jgi:hypothetical protein
MRRHCPVRQSRPRVSPGTEGGVRPMNTPPRRKWHPQASPWSASEEPSRVFTQAKDRLSGSEMSSEHVAG